MAEAVTRHLGGDGVSVNSAGTHPTGRVNPFTLQELQARGYSTARLTSKSWRTFVQPGSPALDYVIYVCEKAAGEMTLGWPASPQVELWRLPAPGAVEGTHDEVRAAFTEVCTLVERAVISFLGQLPRQARRIRATSAT